ncbi:MAG: phosphopantetheine-binding protein [Planctomycetota bacterium]|nr:phosphopantetheine-binding protein [Planctomycetota bacterium]
MKQFIVRQLKLKIAPDQIGTDERLFGGSLGLDSIDALELVVGLEREFGITIPDQQSGLKVFQSVRTLSDFVAGELGKRGSVGK